jgi:zinc transport system ATP-binding protein
MSEPLLTAQQISVQYGDQVILQAVDLSIKAGEIVTLIGPNGAGKTTLVKAVLGLIKPNSGSIQRKSDLCIGYMPQRLHIDPSLPINVERFLRLAHPNKAAIKNALTEVGAGHLEKSPLQNISGGELQRVLLARALLRDPQLLVLDEPVQGVDIAGQSELYQLIETLRDRHQCGVLMVSHDLHLVMAQTDTVICLNQHVCCHGHPEHVSTDPAYLELFGEKYSQSLAVYHHHHDHEHDMHGNVIEGDEHSSCNHNTPDEEANNA